MKRLVLAVLATLTSAGVVQAHNDFTDRAEYFAWPSEPEAYYAPQFYYPAYAAPIHEGRAVYILTPRRWRHR